jgi:hypothetical protein
MRELSHRPVTAAVAVMIATGVALRVAFLLWSDGLMVDDAYITVRCAEHLAAGNGLVYNVGERVLCVSSPLYSLLLAALVRVVSPEAIGYAIGAVNIALFGLAAWWLADALRASGRWVTLLAIAVFAAYLPFADNSTSGMETSLFLVGIVGSLGLLRRRRLGWLSLVLGLLILVRPEGILWAFCVLATAVVLRVRVRLRVILPCLAVCVAWLAISIAYYGSPIPNSVLAKSGVTGGPHWAITARRVLATVRSLSLVNLPPDWVRFVPQARSLTTASLTLGLVLFVVGTWRILRRNRFLLPFALLYILYVGSYLIGKARIDFSWYGVPSGLAFWVVASLGLASVVRFVLRGPLRERLARVVLPAGVAFLVVVGAAAWRIDRMAYYRVVATSYGPAGECVAARASPDAIALADEVGMIGWRAGITVHDLDGITAPDILKMRRGGAAFGVVSVARETAPDFIVVGTLRYRQALEADDGWLDQHYRVVAEYPFHVVLERRTPPPT